MANTLKFRLEINRGLDAIEIGQLESAVVEFRKLLDGIFEDLNFSKDSIRWIASNFEIGSLCYDYVSESEVEDELHGLANRAVSQVISGSRNDAEVDLYIHRKTRAQAKRLFRPFSTGGSLAIGIYTDPGLAKPSSWITAPDNFLVETVAEATPRYSSYGEIQGRIYALHKEGNHPKIRVKDGSSGEMVDCFYRNELYPKILIALQNPNSIVFVSGFTTEDVDTGAIKSMTIESIENAPAWDEDEFNSMIGSFPELTGSLSTEEYINHIRNNG